MLAPPLGKDHSFNTKGRKSEPEIAGRGLRPQGLFFGVGVRPQMVAGLPRLTCVGCNAASRCRLGFAFSAAPISLSATVPASAVAPGPQAQGVWCQAGIFSIGTWAVYGASPTARRRHRRRWTHQSHACRAPTGAPPMHL